MKQQHNLFTKELYHQHFNFNHAYLRFKLQFHVDSYVSGVQLHRHTMNNNDDDTISKLLDAIDVNNIAAASLLIASGVVNLNERPLPLHRAARAGRTEIIALLLGAGADIDVVDENQNQFTACHFAVLHAHFDALKLLVERGAKLGALSSPLLASAAPMLDDDRIVILLLDAGAPLDTLTPGELMQLVSSVAVFERLSARGVDLTALRDACDSTLCHYVARNATRVDDLRWLVGVCGNHAIDAADGVEGQTPLHWAVSKGNMSALRVLVELGADIDRRDSRGRTALHCACCSLRGDEPRVQFLLSFGADIGVVDSKGRTACHVAAEWRKHTALCALVAAGGDLDQPDNKGRTPRRIALRMMDPLPTADEINAARCRIAKTRLDLVRQRAFQICLGLQPLNLDALQLSEIMVRSFGALGSLIAFHQWWAIATKVKHFRDIKNKKQSPKQS
jgi:ankyrin repeat protein